ncbi:MAG: LysE family translocator [Sneathiella sp.]
MQDILLMALFALTLSISPGPVNIIALSSGLNYGITQSVRFIGGATTGFTILLLLIGLGLQSIAKTGGVLFHGLALAGSSLILYFGYKLMTSDGALGKTQSKCPSFWQGFALQWLNPKAWGACVAAISLFNLEQSDSDLYYFVGQYCILCFIGVGSWAVFGNQVERWLDTARKRKLFNRGLGVTLIILAGFLIVQNFAYG